MFVSHQLSQGDPIAADGMGDSRAHRRLAVMAITGMRF
jgi:hypothetical protein